MRKKLIIFDLDGTLVDTLTDVGICFNEALEACGFAPHPLERYRYFVGGNLETVVSRLLPVVAQTNDTIDRVKTEYRRIYKESSKPFTKPFPGIVELLGILEDEGVHMAINSNKGQDLADECVKVLFSKFSLPVAGYREGKPSKPDPSGVFELMQQFNVEAEETLYVGDAGTDIETAKNAGVECLLVAWGQACEEDYSNSSVSSVVQSAEEIAKFALHRSSV